MLRRLRRRVFKVLEPARGGDSASRRFDRAASGVVLVNAAVVVLDTVDALHARLAPAFLALQAASALFFATEYALRFWAAPEDPRFRPPRGTRARYAATPFALMDLAAVLPAAAYVALVGASPEAPPPEYRLLPLALLGRLAKLGRYSPALRAFGRVTRAKSRELLATLAVVLLLLLVASSLMYAVERHAQPRAFSSIPASAWWAVSALGTVGYGDVVPVTPLGRVLGSVVALLGVATFALPAGILAAGFTDELARERSRGGAAARTCPTCGGRLHDAP